MAVEGTEEEDIKEEDKIKLSLEIIFVRELKAFFSQIAKDNKDSILATGHEVSALKYEGQIRLMLEKHYRRVEESFSGKVGEELPEKEQKLSDEEKRLLVDLLMKWREDNSAISSGFIIDTTDRNLKSSIDQARNDITSNGIDPNNINLALIASAIFRKKNKTRPSLISETETQSASENTKFSDALVLSGFSGDGLRATTTENGDISTKRWRTVGDQRVRKIHAAVSGVEKPVDDVFIVGNEFLRYPGDRSLGATSKNLINCRCSLKYDIIRGNN